MAALPQHLTALAHALARHVPVFRGLFADIDPGRVPYAAWAMLPVGGVIALSVLYLLFETGLVWRLATDHPNARSLHTRPTPRCGGLAVTPVAVAALCALAPDAWRIAGVLAGLAIVSWLDDRHGLPSALRFAVQIASVATVMACAGDGLPWWFLGLAGFSMLWFTNLYNFMDGIDGLAGSMTLLGFLTLGIALVPVRPAFAGVAFVVAGGAAGFLVFNWPPARIFMGDVASVPLGFLAATLGFIGWRAGAFAPWFPVVVFLPFIADASVTLLRRLARGAIIWQAHREHYYQRLVQAGRSHRRVTLLYATCMLTGAVLALLLRGRADAVVGAALAGWTLVLVSLGWWIDRQATRPAAER